MTVTPVCIIESQYAPSSTSSLYTSPASTKTIIDSFVATNSSGSTATIAIYLVPSGGSASAANLVSYYSINANTTQNLPEMQYQVLSTGDFIAALAGTGSAIVVRASGRQVV